MKGIQHIAAQQLEQAKWNRTKAADPHTDPRISHEATLTAERLDAAAANLLRQARSDQAIVDNIELLIHDLATSADQSPHRTLAMRSLEVASGHLRRELGYQQFTPDR